MPELIPVTVHIDNNSESKYIFSKTGTFFSMSIKSEAGFYYGFRIFFDPPVIIRKAVDYRFETTISVLILVLAEMVNVLWYVWGTSLVLRIVLKVAMEQMLE